MKKFLLIIAVATAGFIPQLALCNARALVDSAKALSFYQIKQTYPGVNPVEVNPALANEVVTGSNEKHTDGDCPFGKDKKVQVTADKVFGGEAGAQRAGQAAGGAY